jgi:uncharacterized protein RhaS with RHS repeats
MYYRARYYSPDLGRFTQRDPIGLAGGVNMFGYVDGNPVNYRDPTGNSPLGMVARVLIGGSWNVLVNASTIGQPGAPSVSSLFIGGTIGGIIGGAIDNPWVAGAASGAATSGVTAIMNGAPVTGAITAAMVGGSIGLGTGGIAGTILGKVGANDVVVQMGGTAAGIVGTVIVRALMPDANAVVPNACRR